MQPLIFIVDDDPLFSKFLGHQLNSNDFKKVKLFESGEDCLQALKKGKKPKFILLDFSLGALNGLDVLERIQQLTKSTQVIIISNINDESLMQRCLDQGATMWINKEKLMKDFPEELLKSLNSKKGIMSIFR